MLDFTKSIVVNVDITSRSKTLSHFSSYPTVANAFDTVRFHLYGKKAVELVDATYVRFGKPVEPYFGTPYQYAKLCVNKADELGEDALKTVDGHFPILKEDPKVIFEAALSCVFWPYNYVKGAWKNEYHKTSVARSNRSQILTPAYALIPFALHLVAGLFTAIANFTCPRYEVPREQTSKSLHAAQQKADEARKYADEAKKYAEECYAEVRKYDKDKYAEGRKCGEQVGQDGKEGLNEIKEQAK